MLFELDFILNFDNQKILKVLNQIVVESDLKLRQELLLNLHSMDLIHTRGEHTINKPLIVYQNMIYLNCEKRDPTPAEYKEWFEVSIENTRYKYQNINNYKKTLTLNKLRKLIFDLYFNDDLLGRVTLLTSYLYRKPRAVKQRVSTDINLIYLDNFKSCFNSVENN